jgi:hypothetical protein
MDNENINNQNGTLIIKLTDAPFPIDMIDAAMVTITKVEIRKKSEGEELGYPYITVMEDPLEFNLLDLRNGVTADLAEMELEPGIPAGFYTISAAKEGFDTLSVEGVVIVDGNLTVQNFTLTPVEE